MIDMKPINISLKLPCNKGKGSKLVTDSVMQYVLRVGSYKREVKHATILRSILYHRYKTRH